MTIRTSRVGSASTPSSRGWGLQRAVSWWVLTMVGCLALIVSTQLPWATSSSDAGTIAINGFNAVTTLPGSDSLLAQLRSLTISAPDMSSQAATSSDGSSDVIVLPSLSNIPLDLGGSDASAKWGILVLVPGAIALFCTLWTLGGASGGRRGMARAVFVLGALTFVPLLHSFQEGLTDGITNLANGPALRNGVGIFVGLAGAVAMVVGSAFLHWTAQGSDTLL